MIGGLISATQLTLVVLPALYKRFALNEITLREVAANQEKEIPA